MQYICSEKIKTVSSPMSRVPVSTVCMRRREWHKLEPYYCIGYIPHCRPTAAARTLHKEACNDDVLALLKRRIYLQTIDRYDKEQTLPLASLEAQWAGLEHAALCAIRSIMRLYGGHGPSFVYTALQFWPIVNLLKLCQSAPFMPSRLGYWL
jgi:hypothetical protein